MIDGIKALEYRGYDSAGVAVISDDGQVHCEKAVGRVANLEEKIRPKAAGFKGRIGICHSRWATHGGVSEKNAHPHADCAERIWLAHNGIIENYRELKEKLVRAGHEFRSETDTEAVAHLIEEIKKLNPGLGLEETVRLALRKVRGTYGLVVVDADNPGLLVAARNFSPLLIGLGESEYIVASDASAVLKSTKSVIYLSDGDIAVLTPESHRISDLGANAIKRDSEELDWDIAEAQKGGWPHFMLKEIMEEPEAIENSIRGRLLPDGGLAKLGGLASVENKLGGVNSLFISGCGTAYLAGKVGEYMFEEYAGMPVEVDLASELRYRKPAFRQGDAMLAISQSGETADTLAAVLEAKRKGILALGIVNVVGSTIARETDAGVYQHIGPEIGVASTKAFTSQIAILALLTIYFGRARQMSLATGERIIKELKTIPDLMRRVIGESDRIKNIAAKYQKHENFLFLGRKYNMPVALEGALKLKEISYVHAEGYGAGEMKHGPIAMIDEDFPSIAVAPKDSVYEKMISNMEEIRARRGPLVAVATEGDENIRQIADDVIYIPKTLEMLTPLLAVLPLQLFAYHFGVMRGRDVDRPRNLAKSVTVE